MFLSNESLCTSDLQIDIYLRIYRSFVLVKKANANNNHRKLQPNIKQRSKLNEITNQTQANIIENVCMPNILHVFLVNESM